MLTLRTLPHRYVLDDLLVDILLRVLARQWLLMIVLPRQWRFRLLESSKNDAQAIDVALKRLDESSARQKLPNAYAS